jgi:reactive chlorine resistance protein C
MLDHFQIAEKATGKFTHLALLRWTLVVIFLWFGCEKFTSYAANGIAPLIQHSPLVSWLGVFGINGQSRLVGTIELLTAAGLILGAFNPIASAISSAMSCAAFLITMSFFFSTPGVAEASAGGFPVISTLPGQFLLKDLVLFAASLTLLVGSISRPAVQAKYAPDMDLR